MKINLNTENLPAQIAKTVENSWSLFERATQTVFR